jgi:phosphoribosyl 1,2-cyclic phosphodiesterase
MDHIMGLPQFAPFWREDAQIHLHVAEECLGRGEDALFSIMRPPLFPLEACELPAAANVQTFALGAAFMPASGVLVRSVPVSHQGACSAIIIAWRGRKLCYVTDHEHGDADVDARLTEAARGADLLIYDATFTDAEMPAHRGWGHSSWEEGLRLKHRAGVKLLAFAHHHPDRRDADLDALGEAAASACANVFFASQGLSLGL